jgi:hypothetical protein
MTGEGGGVILSTARRVLQREFPAVEEGLRLHVPGEKEKRLGQAVAAATLPRIGDFGSRQSPGGVSPSQSD